MHVGVDYYPEHWPQDRWATDAKLMAEAGLAVVRLAEFAWSRLEPEPGRLEFGWLDEAIRTLANRGIRVVMGTPTATPPKWLCDDAERRGDPVYPVDRYGRPRGFGSRRHYCHNHPRYRRESARIVDAMARHVARSESVMAWQIDNEFGCHDTTLCYCGHCRSAFRAWLKARYGTISELNDAWGTVFWSQIYRSFGEVPLPAHAAVDQPDHTSHNPGLLLDFQRFASDSVAGYQRLQVRAIRAHSAAPITHNFMGHFADIDYYDLAKDLDFVSWDNYPIFQWGAQTPGSLAMAHDIMRGAKGRNFWVMEQLSGPCGWSILGPSPRPGQIGLWSHQGVAHGADAIVYFRWRACTFGTEEYWYGILDHDGIPRRRYAEVKSFAAECRKIEHLVDGSDCPADVLLVRSFDNLWSQRFQPHTVGLGYESTLQAYYDALRAFGAQVDVAGLPAAGVPAHRLVVAPLANLTTPEMEQALLGYVEAGGTLVLTFRSGTRTWSNSMRTDTIPGPFADMAGITVEEFDSLGGRRNVGVRFTDAAGQPPIRDGRATLWCDIVAPRNAEVLATYGSEYYTGSAAVTRASRGKGTVYYVGCDLDVAALRALVESIALKAGVRSFRREYCSAVPPEVEVALRVKDGRGALFLLNHSCDAQRVVFTAELQNLLTGQKVSEAALPPYGVAVMEVKA